MSNVSLLKISVTPYLSNNNNIEYRLNLSFKFIGSVIYSSRKHGAWILYHYYPIYSGGRKFSRTPHMNADNVLIIPYSSLQI